MTKLLTILFLLMYLNGYGQTIWVNNAGWSVKVLDSPQRINVYIHQHYKASIYYRGVIDGWTFSDVKPVAKPDCSWHISTTDNPQTIRLYVDMKHRATFYYRGIIDSTNFKEK